MKSQTSENMADVTCQKCQDVVNRHREVDKDLGKFTIKDDMIGAARIFRNENNIRTTVGKLKKVLREMVTLPTAELERIIASMGPDDVADDDYVSEETGEIYLDAGRPAKSSKLHPQNVLDKANKKAERDAEWARQEAEWDAEDEEYEASKTAANAQLQASYEAAVREFAGNWVNFRREAGDDYDVNDGEAAALEAANDFFHHFPEWKQWAMALKMSKGEIRSTVADFVYEAIRLGRLP